MPQAQIEPTLRETPGSRSVAAPSHRPPVEMQLPDVAWSDPQQTIRAGSRLFSTKVGLITMIGRGTYLAQDPAFHSLGVNCTDLSRFSGFNHTAKSGGAGEKMQIALAATIGEAVERYCMYIYDHREMILARYEEVAADAVHPDGVRLYSRHQIATNPALAHCEFFDERSRIRWVWGYSLTEGRPRLVPASLVFMNYRVDRTTGEVAIGRNASSGLAAGQTLVEAIHNGLLELIERDSFTICWLQRTMGPQVRVDDPELRELMRRRFHADHPAVEIRIFDNTLDIQVPSFLVIMRRPAEFGPALCVGSAARLDPRAAVAKCLAEAGQSLPFLRHLVAAEPDWQPESDFSNVENFDDHARLYVRRPDLIGEAFRFCDREKDEKVSLAQMTDHSTGRPLSEVEYLVDRLREVGSEVIAVDITTPDVRQVGLRAVRVIATQLVPLHGHHIKPFHAPNRLSQVPRQLAWQQRGWDPESGLNPFPHPFP